MNLGDIYKYLEVVTNKHRSGNKFSPDEFNYVLKLENINFFNHKVKEIQNSAKRDADFREMLLSSKMLRPLLVSQDVTPITGVYDLITGDDGLDNTFVHWASALTTAVFNGAIKRVELVNHNEYEKRQVNLLSPPIYYFPIAEIVGDNLNILPTNITEIKLTYIKLPSDPVFDYYSDANRNVIYLTDGQPAYELDTGEVGSAGQVSPTEVTSLSNELDYGVEFYSEFTDYLLSKLGIRGESPIVIQTAENEKMKDSM